MTSPPERVDRALVWFRRDLRVDDHAALYHALRTAREVHCAFILDREILDALPRADRRVEFILGALRVLDEDLRRLSGALIVRHGFAVDEIPRLAAALGAQVVFANHDDEPQSLQRDALVAERLASFNARLRTFKDHVVFERREVMTATGGPYGVFTPYKNAWLRKVDAFYLSSYPVERHATALAPTEFATGVPSLQDIGFRPAGLTAHVGQGSRGAQTLLDDFLDRIGDYDKKRDFPAVKGPSYLSVHLRFGTVSIRRLARIAHQLMQGGDHGAEVWLSELIWRDFYHQVMHHHPQAMTAALRPEYDQIQWETGAHADELFNAWCEGRTGYPLVDAAMRQLNQTGYMHNRLRMVTASFLTKDLGIDWRRGEAWFAQQLLDYDLAANNGGWQWASSSGCDAQPYFRIFNPTSQSEKFDAEGHFIRRYCPELADLSRAEIHAPWRSAPLQMAGRDYPQPVVDHALARERALARYAVVKRPAA
jgi:deoxyribodipyrimidine photo-lyase